jgi:hypothetical protein
MKLRILIAFILTLVLLSIARKLAERKPELKTVEFLGTRIEHTTVTEKVGGGDVDLTAKVVTSESTPNYQIDLLYKIGEGGYSSSPMISKPENPQTYSAKISSQPKGERVYYYIKVRDNSGNEITLPEKVETKSSPFMIKFKGKASPLILVLHIFSMFAGMFFSWMAFFYAWEVMKGRKFLNQLGLSSLMALIFIFLGGFPLSFSVAYQTFGQAWGGIPFGWDITDNKTLIILIFWLVIVWLLKGTIFKKDENRNLASPKKVAGLTIIFFILTVFVYLIPHSIRI